MVAQLDHRTVLTIIWEPRVSLEEVFPQIPKDQFPGSYTGRDKKIGG
jgi:hypothetical protein